MLSQQFEVNKVWPISFVTRKLSAAKSNYNVFEKEMLAIVHVHKKWRHFLQEARHNTIIYSNHQNLTSFQTVVTLNCRQARWAEALESFNLDLFYGKGNFKGKADALSRCPAFTSREGGTTAAGERTLLRQEQWLEVAAMGIHQQQPQFLSETPRWSRRL